MQPALHQDARAAKLDSLANLFVDCVEIEDVSLGSQLAFKRPIESTKRAILRAKVRVVDIAIDDVRDHAFRMQLAAERVSVHTNANEVIGAEHLKRLLSSKGHLSRF